MAKAGMRATAAAKTDGLFLMNSASFDSNHDRRIADPGDEDDICHLPATAARREKRTKRPLA